MSKRVIVLALAFCALLAFASASFAGDIKKVSIAEAAAKERIPDEHAIRISSVPGIPYQDDATASPGLTVGKTYYDYQTNGSTGRRIAKHECGVHMSWMNGVTNSTGERVISYNYADPSGNLSWGDE